MHGDGRVVTTHNNEKVPYYYKHYPFLFVKPYPYIYRTFVKQRWLNRYLFEVLTAYFKAYDANYYSHAIATGRITVNNLVVPANYQLRSGDYIVHYTIRKECPVLDLPIRIIHEDNNYVVVDKPPSIVVHTGGGQHYNTVMAIMKHRMGYDGLQVLHRLDKGTSGVLFMYRRVEGKSKPKVETYLCPQRNREESTVIDEKQNKTQTFHKYCLDEVIKKIYYARVDGEVYWQHMVLDASIECLSHKDGVYGVSQERSFREFVEGDRQKLNNRIVDDYYELTEYRMGKQMRGKKEKRDEGKGAKYCQTIFNKVWYDAESNSTLLYCYPITGRTHQIRVHLKHLGHPILNDVNYGGRFIGNKIIESIPKGIVGDKYIKYVNEKQFREQEDEDDQEKPRKKMKLNEEEESWDYWSKPWEICLHAYKYVFEGKEYVTKMPYWTERKDILIGEKGNYQVTKGEDNKKYENQKKYLKYFNYNYAKYQREAKEPYDGNGQKEVKEGANYKTILDSLPE